MLAPGAAAPDFDLHDVYGRPFRLGALRNQWVVLWWYPEANSSGCSVQAVSLSKSLNKIEAAGAQVVGISFNTVSENDAFACDKGLSYPLIADPDRVAGRAYEVIRDPDEPYATKPKRITYYIDPDGVIAHVELVDRDWLSDYGAHVLQTLDRLRG